jgi:hypothetical protein
MKPRTEEEIPRRITAEVTFDTADEARRRLLESTWCSLCGKLSLKTKADAHNYIGLTLSKRWRTPKPGEHTWAPYPCPHGDGWHVGRNPETAELLRKKQP